MSKDRAAPFSKKHRRYWIPVTGGMVLIGIINVLIGLHSYKAPENPDRIHVVPQHDAAPEGTLANWQLPADVMRAFSIKYPHLIPAGARIEGVTYVIAFPPGQPQHHATFAADGSFVSED